MGETECLQCDLFKDRRLAFLECLKKLKEGQNYKGTGMLSFWKKLGNIFYSEF